jgi:hypothetical protein
MRGLNFWDQKDIGKWKERCAEQRKIAETYPAYDLRMSSVDEYGWTLGPWSLRLVLEIWQKPFMWHASAAIVEQIGYESVTLNSRQKVELPQDALLSVSAWVPEHYEQARFVLAEMLGPALRPNDDSQRAEEYLGLWAMHHRVKYEGDRPWRKLQH